MDLPVSLILFIYGIDLYPMNPLVIDAPGKLGKILIGMNKALGEIPVTVKLRMGVREAKHTAHKLMPRLVVDWNAACLTVSIHNV